MIEKNLFHFPRELSNTEMLKVRRKVRRLEKFMHIKYTARIYVYVCARARARVRLCIYIAFIYTSITKNLKFIPISVVCLYAIRYIDISPV
jgi:hypothetical protein